MALTAITSGVVFPASAGMIRTASVPRHPGRGVPRIRGDDPLSQTHKTMQLMCSPHPRG